MNDKMINSHIQMPRCVLKRFENEQHFMYYYDVKKEIIGNNGHAKSINTQEGYFSPDVEEILNNRIEKPFADVLSFIDNIDFETPNSIITPEGEKTIKNFIYALCVRDSQMLSSISEHSVFFQFFSEQDQHDIAVIEGMNQAQILKTFDPYTVTFTINRTQSPFVLPTRGLYSYKMNGVNLHNLPISPEIAITLINKNDSHKIIENDIMMMFLINSGEEKAIDAFNGFAVKTQCQSGQGYVVSTTSDALKKAVQHSGAPLKSHK